MREWTRMLGAIDDHLLERAGQMRRYVAVMWSVESVSDYFLVLRFPISFRSNFGPLPGCFSDSLLHFATSNDLRFD